MRRTCADSGYIPWRTRDGPVGSGWPTRRNQLGTRTDGRTDVTSFPDRIGRRWRLISRAVTGYRSGFTFARGVVRPLSVFVYRPRPRIRNSTVTSVKTRAPPDGDREIIARPVNVRALARSALKSAHGNGALVWRFRFCRTDSFWRFLKKNTDTTRGLTFRTVFLRRGRGFRRRSGSVRSFPPQHPSAYSITVRLHPTRLSAIIDRQRFVSIKCRIVHFFFDLPPR